jgi:uncharacterized protein HemX
MLIITHGALIATVLAGAIAFGRASNRTEAALARSEQVPALAANFEAMSRQLAEIGRKQDQFIDGQNKRLDTLQAQVNAYGLLSAKVDAIQGQMGSVWALAQADSNKISRLEGMIIAMQQNPKEK